MRAVKTATRQRLSLVVRAAPGSRSLAILQAGHLAFRAAIGRSGLTVLKREGDGATPVAVMGVFSGYRRAERVRQMQTALPMRSIARRDLWCDAPDHACYNRPVSAPFGASHEQMRRADGLYDICLVLDWNMLRRSRGRGSAIFFHLARPDYTPTEGCVAIARRDMLRLLPHLRKGTRMKVVK